MASNIILVMANLLESSQGDGTVLIAGDLVQISLSSNNIQSENISNFSIQHCSIKIYQHPEILCQNYESKIFN